MAEVIRLDQLTAKDGALRVEAGSKRPRRAITKASSSNPFNNLQDDDPSDPEDNIFVISDKSDSTSSQDSDTSDADISNGEVSISVYVLPSELILFYTCRLQMHCLQRLCRSAGRARTPLNVALNVIFAMPQLHWR
jgi:hypothetical protein